VPQGKREKEKSKTCEEYWARLIVESEQSKRRSRANASSMARPSRIASGMAQLIFEIGELLLRLGQLFLFILNGLPMRV
jgi:hypothetical protein